MLCFRPVVNVDEVVPGSKADDKCSNDQPLACVGVDKGKNVKENLKSNSLILDYRFSKCSGNSLIIHSARKTSFFQSFKSIFFLYSLVSFIRFPLPILSPLKIFVMIIYICIFIILMFSCFLSPNGFVMEKV